MVRRLIQTTDDTLPLILRLTLGIVMLPHGAQKVLGWFGGPGFTGEMGYFAQIGIPAFFGVLAIIAEFFGALGLIVGLLSRVAAFGIGVVMVVAILMAHLQFGFFMNWFGNQKGEGFEYHLLVIGIALALIIRGGGVWSLDHFIWLQFKDASVGPDERQHQKSLA